MCHYSTIGQSNCQWCPAGYYCPLNTTDPVGSPCPPGYYCPQGTDHAHEFPCPPGTYNPHQGMTNSTACLICPPGEYCEVEGSDSPTGNCSVGWFCTGGAHQSKPVVFGEYTLLYILTA